MTHVTSETFDQNARVALRDTQLRGALDNLVKTFGDRRKEVIKTVDDWEGLRNEARRIKDETLLNLDRYLEQFTGNAEKAGAVIHWARDGREACGIILDLIDAHDATNVVKSKSMATEEIHLFLATGLSDVERPEVEEDERIDVEVRPLSDLDAILAETKDSKTLIGLYRLKDRLGAR